MTPYTASKTFNWFKINPEDGVPELYLDHHILSTVRLCEAKFLEEHVLSPSGDTMTGVGNTGRGRSWSLDFGSVWHNCMQSFYNKLKDTGTVPREWALSTEDGGWLKECANQWLQYDLDQFRDQPAFKAMGGLNQFIALLIAYYSWFGEQQEHFRVVATEVGFGRQREVPLQIKEYKYQQEYEFEKNNFPNNLPFRAYLCGRIDLLIDDGFRIIPVDHKTRSRFTGHEQLEYNPHEGMTGYAYATRCIVGKMFPQLREQGRLTDSIWINHVSLQYNKQQQFKRSRITKTAEQFEQFRLRQLSTFMQVWELIINERPAQWNTFACRNIYHKDCEWATLHECPQEQRMQIFNTHYTSRDASWNPYDNPTNTNDSKRMNGVK